VTHLPPTDVLLVGAGPIGLEMAAALKLAGIDYLHLEAGNIASTIGWYAPGTQIFSAPERLAIAGVPFLLSPQVRATREDYLNYLRTVALLHKLEVRSYRRVVAIRKRDDGFEADIVRSEHGAGGPDEIERSLQPVEAIDERVVCSRIILAFGDMHWPNLLGVPGEELPHVSHYFEEPHRYFGQKVTIVGAKNSAAEAAVRLSRQGTFVTICHRSDDFDETRIKPWLLPELRLLIRENKMRFVPRVMLKSIDEDAVHVRHESDMVEAIPSDAVLLLTGYRQNPGLFEQLGIELTGPGRAPTFDAETMESSVKNVYLAGTCSAGTQIGGVKAFVETSHVHVDRILRALGAQTCSWIQTTIRCEEDREQ
jgi:thioredoxin reductase (NADPH)